MGLHLLSCPRGLHVLEAVRLLLMETMLCLGLPRVQLQRQRRWHLCAFER